MPRLVVSQFGDTTPRFRSKVEPVVEMIMRFPLVERNRSERMDERRGCVLLGDNDAVDADRHQIRAVNYQRVLAGDDVAGQHVDDAARQVAIVLFSPCSAGQRVSPENPRSYYWTRKFAGAGSWPPPVEVTENVTDGILLMFPAASAH